MPNRQQDVYISDLHLGRRHRDDSEKAMKKAMDNFVAFLSSRRFGKNDNLIIAGDFIAGPGERHSPLNECGESGWEDLLREQVGPLAECLRSSQIKITYLLGNTERRKDLDAKTLERRFGKDNLNFTDDTGRAALWQPETKTFVMHGQQCEYSGKKELLLAAARALAERIPFLSGPLQKLMLANRTHSHENAKELSELSLKDVQNALDQLAEMDEAHQKSADTLYGNKPKELLVKLLMPFLKEALVNHYIHSAVRSVRHATNRVLRDDPGTIVFGHIHRALLFNREEIGSRFGIDGVLPEAIVNTGSGLPMGRLRGGNKQSHFAIRRDTDKPIQLWKTSGKKCELVKESL